MIKILALLLSDSYFREIKPAVSVLWSPVLVCIEGVGVGWVRAEAAMMQLGRLHWWEEEDGGWRRQQLGEHLKRVVLYAAVDSGGCRLHPALARQR